MPVQVKYLDDGIGIELVASDIVTGEDIISANNMINSHENYSGKRYKLVNRTLVSEYRVNNNEIHIIAEQEIAASKINPDIVIALISTTDHQKGMTRMYQAYVSESGLKTAIFRDRITAIEWINMQLATPENSIPDDL